MKTLNDYINEKFQVSKDNIRKYTYYPKNKNELIKCIIQKINKEGLGTKDKPLDLNDIDTSEITDMSELFYDSNFDGDISDWDVSNVKNMESMFYCSAFTGENGDISNWDVSNVEDMEAMFWGSSFNGDISNWDVSNVKDMRSMFYCSKFAGKNGDLNDWDVNISNAENMRFMFANCPLEKNPPKWYKTKR